MMRAVALVLALAAAPVSALAAPQIANAWMRPVAAGTASADAYADVRTDAPITLVAVRTPVARAVEIVVHNPKDPASTPHVVDRLALPAGETRFALRGSVLRLVGVLGTAAPGQPVPLAFEFADATGGKVVVEAFVEVRGLVAAQPAAPR